jgi:DNA-binding response OmpR family regulator
MPQDSESKIVLVLDREAAIRTLLKAVLTENGYRVREGSGVHALKLCEASGERVDVILSEEPLGDSGKPVIVLPKPFAIPNLLASIVAALPDGDDQTGRGSSEA